MIKSNVFIGPQIRKILECSKFLEKLTTKLGTTLMQWFINFWAITNLKIIWSWLPNWCKTKWAAKCPSKFLCLTLIWRSLRKKRRQTFIVPWQYMNPPSSPRYCSEPWKKIEKYHNVVLATDWYHTYSSSTLLCLSVKVYPSARCLFMIYKMPNV